MKMKTAKIFIASGLFLMFSKLYAFPLEIRAEPDTGIIFGRINEYAYFSGDESMHLLSHLEWNISPRWYMGAKISVYIFDLFFIKAEGKLLGLHGKSGEMTDRDWQNISLSDREEYNYVTDFSRHDNYFEKYADMRLSIGLSFDAPLLFKIEPSISVRLQKFEFAARNGYGMYGAYDSFDGIFSSADDAVSKVYFRGDVISYRHDRFFMDAGLRLSTTLFPLLFLSAYVDASFLSQITATDTHHIKGTIFRDFFSSFGELNFGLDTFLVIGRKRTSRAGLSIVCQYIPKITGEEEFRSEELEYWTEDRLVFGGTDSIIWSLSLSFSYMF